MRYRTDRIRRRSMTPAPTPFHSISSDKSPRSCWGCRSLSMEVVRRDHTWSSSRRAVLHNWYFRAYYSRLPDSSVGRTHIRSGRHHCSCQKSGPKYCVLVPRSSRRIRYNPAVVAEGEAAAENSNPYSSSDIQDHRRESQPADNTSIEGQYSDSRPDARHRSDRNTCIRSRNHRWGRWWPAGTAWWSRHNMVAVALLRKCSRCELIPRMFGRRSQEHHRHTDFGTWWSEPPMSLMLCSMSTRRSPNRVPASWWWMSSSQHSRFAFAHQLLPAPESDLVSAAGRNSSGRSDRRVLDSRRVPEPSASLRDQRHQTSLRRGNGLSTDCRLWLLWSAARAADSDG